MGSIPWNHLGGGIPMNTPPDTANPVRVRSATAKQIKEQEAEEAERRFALDCTKGEVAEITRKQKGSR